MPTKTNRFHHFISYFFLFLLVLFDQWSKLWAQGRDLTVLNYGGVFGLFPGRWWAVFLVIVWVVLVWEFLRQAPDTVGRFGYGLLLAGGLGNLIDRLLFGAVRDFIYYPMFGFYGNGADIILAIGVGILITHSLKRKE